MAVAIVLVFLIWSPKHIFEPRVFIVIFIIQTSHPRKTVGDADCKIKLRMLISPDFLPHKQVTQLIFALKRPITLQHNLILKFVLPFDSEIICKLFNQVSNPRVIINFFQIFMDSFWHSIHCYSHISPHQSNMTFFERKGFCNTDIEIAKIYNS